jgi:ParB family chromosome partitioning protein
LQRVTRTSLGRFIPLVRNRAGPEPAALGDGRSERPGHLDPRQGSARAAPRTASTRGSTKSFRIISGERRYRASIEAGLFEVPAIEMDVTDQEALEIALIENLQRKDLTPVRRGRGLPRPGRTARVHPRADRRGHGPFSARRSPNRWGLLAMPAKVRDAVNALGVTSKSTLLEILRTGDEPTMLALLERARAKGSRARISGVKASLSARAVRRRPQEALRLQVPRA